MSIKIGDKAPDFRLKDQNANDVSLSEFKGKNVVLLFFPLAGSSVCTAEMCRMRDEMHDYEKLNAQILGISVDSHFALKIWAEKNNYDFPLLSDFNKEVSAKYDSLYEIFAPGKLDYKGVSKRSAFVIGKDGKIKYAEVCSTPGEQPNYDSIEKALE